MTYHASVWTWINWWIRCLIKMLSNIWYKFRQAILLSALVSYQLYPPTRAFWLLKHSNRGNRFVERQKYVTNSFWTALVKACSVPSIQHLFFCFQVFTIELLGRKSVVISGLESFNQLLIKNGDITSTRSSQLRPDHVRERLETAPGMRQSL